MAEAKRLQMQAIILSVSASVWRPTRMCLRMSFYIPQGLEVPERYYLALMGHSEALRDTLDCRHRNVLRYYRSYFRTCETCSSRKTSVWLDVCLNWAYNIYNIIIFYNALNFLHNHIFTLGSDNIIEDAEIFSRCKLKRQWSQFPTISNCSHAYRLGSGQRGYSCCKD